MKDDYHSPKKTQSISDYQSVVVQPRTRGGQFLVRQYGVAAGVADLVAALAGFSDLAGFGSEVR